MPLNADGLERNGIVQLDGHNAGHGSFPARAYGLLTNSEEFYLL